MNERIDVLAVMDALEKDFRDEGLIVSRLDSADVLREARAAVAELIEAQRKAHDAMLLADWNVPGLCSERQHAAYCASAAALARVGSP